MTKPDPKLLALLANSIFDDINAITCWLDFEVSSTNLSWHKVCKLNQLRQNMIQTLSIIANVKRTLIIENLKLQD